MSQTLAAEPKPETSTEFSPKVLITKTDVVSRALYEELFEEQNIRLVFKESGPGTVDYLLAEGADLVIVNYETPAVSGVELCRLIRSEPALSNIPVLMVTARDDRRSKLEALDSGADDFIAKPFDLDELEARVRTILKANRFRRMDALRHRFEMVAERLPQGLLILDAGGNVIYINEQAREWLKLEKTLNLPFAIEAHCREYFECRGGFATGWTSFLKSSNGEIVLIEKKRHSEHEPRWFSCQTSFLTSRADGQMLLFMEEVTQQARQRNLNWSLRTILSHKLRTPLNGLIGPLDFICEGSDLDEEQREMLQIARHSASRLNTTFENLLQYLETVDSTLFQARTPIRELENLLRSVCQEHNTMACRKHTDETCPDGLVTLPLETAEAIFTELVCNACKFHPRGRPTLEVMTRYDTEKERFDLILMDDGKGLAEEDLEKVVQPFYQVDPYVTGEIPGEGLGLSRINQLLWAAGGYLEVHNRQDRKGLEVVIHLKALEDEEPSTEGDLPI